MKIKIEDFKASVGALTYRDKKITIVIVPHKLDVGVDVILRTPQGKVLDRATVEQSYLYGDALGMRRYVIDSVNELLKANKINHGKK